MISNEQNAIVNGPSESAPNDIVDSTSFDNRNETAPRKRNKVLNIIKASKAANMNHIAAARAKESDQQMEETLGDAKKQQQAMSIVHKLERAKMAKEMKDSERKLLQLKEEKQKAEEDINLLQLQYDVLEHELSARKIDADRASREFDDITEKWKEATENLVSLRKEVKSKKYGAVL